MAVLGPLTAFTPETPPELAILLANADQLSALVFLLQHDARMTTGGW